jgi:ABC-type sugar transport system ATPase subunit
MTTSSAELADDRLRKRSCFGRKKGTKEGQNKAKPMKFKEAPPKMIRGFQLKGIDFEVKKGELVAIVGAVGSGYGYAFRLSRTLRRHLELLTSLHESRHSALAGHCVATWGS